MSKTVSRRALITGASSGIGEAFAKELASRGYDLIITARRAHKLESLADILRKNHLVDVEVLVADLSKTEDIKGIENYIVSAKQIDLLINNAGFGVLGRFSDIGLDKLLDMIHVHIIASIRLCKAVVPKMIAHGGGVIINVSSMTGLIPMVGYTTYSATKAFLTVFSQRLQVELKHQGITVQALCPGFTYTEFHDTHGFKDFKRSTIPNWLWMSAEEVVTLSLIALHRDKVVFIPGVKNRLLVRLMNNAITAPILRRSILRRKST